jgi:hypothetical protein
MTEGRTIAIGDVHGCSAALAALVRAIDPTPLDTTVFYSNLWGKRLTWLEALRQAQLAVLRDPGRVEARNKELRQELA